MFPGCCMNTVRAEAFHEGKAGGSAVSQRRLSPPSSSLGFSSWGMNIAAQLAKCLSWTGRSLQELWLFSFPLVYLFQVVRQVLPLFLSMDPYELFCSGFFMGLSVSAINSLRAFCASEVWSLTVCSWDTACSSLTPFRLKWESNNLRKSKMRFLKKKTSILSATECSLSLSKA